MKSSVIISRPLGLTDTCVERVEKCHVTWDRTEHMEMNMCDKSIGLTKKITTHCIVW